MLLFAWPSTRSRSVTMALPTAAPRWVGAKVLAPGHPGPPRRRPGTWHDWGEPDPGRSWRPGSSGGAQWVLASPPVPWRRRPGGRVSPERARSRRGLRHSRRINPQSTSANSEWSQVRTLSSRILDGMARESVQSPGPLSRARWRQRPDSPRHKRRPLGCWPRALGQRVGSSRENTPRLRCELMARCWGQYLGRRGCTTRPRLPKRRDIPSRITVRATLAARFL